MEVFWICTGLSSLNAVCWCSTRTCVVVLCIFLYQGSVVLIYSEAKEYNFSKSKFCPYASFFWRCS